MAAAAAAGRRCYLTAGGGKMAAGGAACSEAPGACGELPPPRRCALGGVAAHGSRVTLWEWTAPTLPRGWRHSQVRLVKDGRRGPGCR